MRSRLFFLFFLLFCCTTGVFAQSPRDTVRLLPYARVKHPPIAEMSGITTSARYGNTYWVLNDSGDEPRIFAIDSAGKLIMPPWLSKEYYADDSLPNKKPYPGIKID